MRRLIILQLLCLSLVLGCAGKNFDISQCRAAADMAPEVIIAVNQCLNQQK